MWCVQGIDLINRLLTYDPAVRITVRPPSQHAGVTAVGGANLEVFWQAREAIEHPYFREKPFPQEASMMPTFPSLHPDRKDSATQSDGHRQQQQQRTRDSMRFGQAFGGPQAPSTAASVASALKKRRV